MNVSGSSCDAELRGTGTVKAGIGLAGALSADAEGSLVREIRSSSYKAADGTNIETHAYQNTKTGQVVEPKSKMQ